MSNDSVKIIFFGTSDFAIPAFRALVEHGYDIAAVVTNPDEPAGRGEKIVSTPVKIFAEQLEIFVFQPEKLETEKWKSEIPAADLYIVAAYGKIIPKSILEIPKFGALNIHPSLLPRWRGPSPIQYAILNGDEKTGVTIMLIDEKMDHGPILAQQELEVSNATYGELYETLAKLGANLLIETLPKWIKGEIQPIPQNSIKATYSKMVKKDDTRINWKKHAKEIERMVRAFNPKPGTWTIWPHRDALYRIRIEKGNAVEDEPHRGFPGYVWQKEADSFFVRAGSGSIALSLLTLEGKKSVDSSSFIRGYPSIIGSTLI